MKVEQLEVRLGRTVNMGNYESLRVDVGVRVNDLPEGVQASDSIEVIRKQLHKELDTLVHNEVEAWRT